MYPGVYDWYVDRINAIPNSSFKCGLEMLGMIRHCVAYDDMLTSDEVNSIITQCNTMHVKLLEGDFNNGWYEQ